MLRGVVGGVSGEGVGLAGAGEHLRGGGRLPNGCRCISLGRSLHIGNPKWPPVVPPAASQDRWRGEARWRRGSRINIIIMIMISIMLMLINSG